jgi:hypothetical protein
MELLQIGESERLRDNFIGRRVVLVDLDVAEIKLDLYLSTPSLVVNGSFRRTSFQLLLQEMLSMDDL